MGLFDDAGIDPDDLVTGLEDGPHPAVLSKVFQKDFKYGNKIDPEATRPNLVFEYEVEGAAFPVNKLFPIAPGPISEMDDTDDTYNVYPVKTRIIRQTEQAFWRGQYRNLKQWLIGHGVDPADVNRVDPQDLVGTKVVLSTKRSKTGFTNAVNVAVEGASGTSLPTRSASASAQTSASATAPASAVSAPTGTVKVNPFAK